VLGLAITTPAFKVTSIYDQIIRYILHTAAPEDLEPNGPIFARIPALAMGDSVATYWSTAD
jgi:hypothetical protein